MNRELQIRNSRRKISRRLNLRGGGYGMGAPLVPIPSGPGADWNFAVKQPINQGFDDCLFPARPGELFNMPQPAIAQAGWPTLGGAGGGEMSGGGKRSRKQRRRRAQRGGKLSEEDLIIGRTFYEYDAAENEIIRHIIEHIEGDEVRSLKHSGPVPVSVINEKADLIDAEKFDTQLQNLRSLYPGAAIMAENPFEIANSENEVATVVAPPNSNNNAGAVSQTGGGAVDNIEASHAYRWNGWTQELSHGATPATEWGRDTGLIQTVMAGGSRKRVAGGAIDPIEASHAYPPNGWETPSTHGAPLPTWGPQTGLVQEVMVGGKKRRASRRAGAKKQRGGGCACSGSRLFGGSRRRSTRRRAGARKQKKQRGGSNYGYAIDPSVSIGGSGPNVDALRTGVPCDPRAGSMNPNNHELPADPRAYGVGYSATPNTTLPTLQAGGAYSTGNAFPDSCYKAPGSELPVYNAQTAGFNFYPSTAHNGTLPDGVTPYNDVVPYAARMGGARRRKSRKVRKGRKGSKGGKGRKGSRRH